MSRPLRRSCQRQADDPVKTVTPISRSKSATARRAAFDVSFGSRRPWVRPSIPDVPAPCGTGRSGAGGLREPSRKFTIFARTMAIGRPRLDADIRRWQCGGLSPAAIAGKAFAGSRRCALVDPKVAWRHRRGPPPHDQPADPESFRHQLYPPMSPESEQLEEGTPGRNRVTAVALSRNRRRSASSMPAVPSRLQRRPRGWCQWPSVSPQLRPSVLPTGGHVGSPLVAIGSPQHAVVAKPSP
jgi:hypothetical protein